MAARTTFWAAIGQTPIAALKKASTTQAVRLSTRKRSTRVCRSEKTSSALPAQPIASSQDIGPPSVEAERERRLEVVARVGAERDVGLRAGDARDLVEPVGDH